MSGKSRYKGPQQPAGQRSRTSGAQDGTSTRAGRRPVTGGAAASEASDTPPARDTHFRISPALLALGTVAALLGGFLIGYLLRGNAPSSPAVAVPASDSVEAGFARDMIVHHNQGITMANEAELHTDDDEIRLMAYDIGATQLAQVGQMQGWLALWQQPEQVVGSSPMAWMGHDMTGMSGQSSHDMTGMSGQSSHDMATTSGMSGMTMPTTGPIPSAGATTAQTSPGAEHSGHDMSTANATSSATASPTNGTLDPSTINTADDSAHKALMPGMATSGEMAKLNALRGKASDVYFLQLMIRHHQGGQAMMAYAAQHATNPVVANFAQKMYETQTSEVAVMTQMLQQRGAAPLPFDPGH